MSINWDIVLKIVMPLATLFLGAWLKNFLEAKEKLIAHYGHVSSFKLRKPEGEKGGEMGVYPFSSSKKYRKKVSD